MFYEPAKRNHGLPHDPFKAIVAPRPIGWITTMSAKGEINLAPYSFFNGVSTHPPVVMFSSEGHKDSVTNAKETGEFVCNYVSFDLREAMNRSSAPVGAEISEMDYAGLEAAPSRLVRPPRVAAAVAALECRYLRTVELTGHDGRATSYFLVLGEVVGIHVDDRLLSGGRFDSAAAHPIARGGYHDYMHGNQLFALERPQRA